MCLFHEDSDLCHGRDSACLVFIHTGFYILILVVAHRLWLEATTGNSQLDLLKEDISRPTTGPGCLVETAVGGGRVGF